jgi:hypothetical protein
VDAAGGEHNGLVRVKALTPCRTPARREQRGVHDRGPAAHGRGREFERRRDGWAPVARHHGSANDSIGVASITIEFSANNGGSATVATGE